MNIKYRQLIAYFLVFIGIVFIFSGFIGLLYAKNKSEVGYAILLMTIIGPGIVVITTTTCIEIEDRMILERRRLVETV